MWFDVHLYDRKAGRWLALDSYGSSAEAEAARRQIAALGVPARVRPAKRELSFVQLLPGGKGDRLRPRDVNVRELVLGLLTEHEHTRSSKLALEIALDHLAEDRRYYTKLLRAGL